MKSIVHRFLPLLLLAALAGCAFLQDQGLRHDPGSDEGLAAAATGRLNSDPLTARATLSVSVENGVATLYGVVPDLATRERALQLVRGTSGIREVVDRTRRR